MLQDILWFVVSFVVLWIGAGLSIIGIERISRSIKISSFLISFFALGLLTSVSEISVAYFSVVDKTPGMSVGNLIGGSIVLTVLIIPLLAILNKGIVFDDRAEPINFPLVYLIISLPVFLIIDGRLTYFDAFIILFSCAFMAFTISAKNTLLDKIENVINHHNVNVLKESIRILAGIVLIVGASKFIVDTTVIYAAKFSISPFMVGLVLLSIGTNLPELSILIRSTIYKKKNIALGDYVGSAAINTLVLGFLPLLNRGPVYIDGGLKYNLFLLPIGSVLFLLFSKNGKLDRREGFVLLCLYVLFLVLEF